MRILFYSHLTSLKAFSEQGSSVLFQAQRSNGSWICLEIYCILGRCSEEMVLRKLGLLGDYHNMSAESDRAHSDLFVQLCINLSAARSWSMLTHCFTFPEMLAGMLDANRDDVYKRLAEFRCLVEMLEEARAQAANQSHPEIDEF
jgi:hypothetical protein